MLLTLWSNVARIFAHVNHNLILHSFPKHAHEAVTRGFLCVQCQTGLLKEPQVSHGYVVRLFVTEEEEEG